MPDRHNSGMSIRIKLIANLTIPENLKLSIKVTWLCKMCKILKWVFLCRILTKGARSFLKTRSLVLAPSFSYFWTSFWLSFSPVLINNVLPVTIFNLKKKYYFWHLLKTTVYFWKKRHKWWFVTRNFIFTYYVTNYYERISWGTRHRGTFAEEYR